MYIISVSGSGKNRIAKILQPEFDIYEDQCSVIGEGEGSTDLKAIIKAWKKSFEIERGKERREELDVEDDSFTVLGDQVIPNYGEKQHEFSLMCWCNPIKKMHSDSKMYTVHRAPECKKCGFYTCRCEEFSKNCTYKNGEWVPNDDES